MVDVAGGWQDEVDRSAWPQEWLADELEGIQRRRARDAAEEAELILGLADQRPATTDPDGPGARRPGWTADGEPGTSEFFLAELSAILNLGRGTAAHRFRRALTWRHKLPATLAALKAGEIDERRADALADVLGHTSAEIAAQVEDALLPRARDLSVYRLRDRASALMLHLDSAAAEERRKEAEQTADVHVYPSGVEGRATLAVDLPTDEAAECHDLIDQLARMLKADGDPRPIGVLRTHVHSALIRRPADNGLPLVAADLRITATLDSLTGVTDEPGEVDGLPITAAHLRELLARVGALGLTAPDGGTLTFAVTGPDGRLLATMTPAELTRLARRGCTRHPEDESCSCPVLGPPPPTDAYAPTEKQRAFVTTRDQRCRFPNCGQRVGWADLDHVHAHGDGGATDCTNLCCLCRSHHRLKTFAPGWRFRLADDGTLHVTTPSGVTRTTRPPGLRPPPESPPDGPPPAGRPPPTDDPPPF
ncbi:DUF222 domain-containing protein [Modestobacter muralis]|uniref:DUF222 domain-containing protein n=1 Tax=Modestobacter muralis TaxID=1608614 RepID=A0A6P0ETQ0_9ACTN|nr:DUF222 domain-containing protein [Modestobacter muralis]NEN51920.1 DUF222 domain-containing protein [Modestobacter muralis]